MAIPESEKFKNIFYEHYPVVRRKTKQEMLYSTEDSPPTGEEVMLSKLIKRMFVHGWMNSPKETGKLSSFDILVSAMLKSQVKLVSGPVEKLQETLGYTSLSSALLENIKTVYVNNSWEVTMNFNIEAINKTMKRLGAEHLLPESIDGKLITLHIPEIVNYDLSSDNENWARLRQMNTPVLTVDPSIKVEEALEVIINSPLLPDYLKTSLQQSSILSGELPMPLIKRDQAEQITVKGTSVILNRLR